MCTKHAAMLQMIEKISAQLQLRKDFLTLESVPQQMGLPGL